jgi:hypothetical protein
LPLEQSDGVFPSRTIGREVIFLARDGRPNAPPDSYQADATLGKVNAHLITP